MTEQAEMHEVSLGETVDGFKVEELIHESQVSKLYRVSHPDHQFPLVMKVPKITVMLPSSVFAGFETEMRILSRLRGVYTPRIYSKGDLAVMPYLVMEYVQGEALKQAITQAPVSVHELCQLMIPVCKAVHELHRHNIIHLDLKPENIRNRDDGTVVLIDMGTAHQSQIPDMYTTSHEQQPITTDYVAPEQLFEVRTESRSDLYAIGVMLYELATGTVPFPNANILTVKKRIYVPPPPPKYVKPDLPDWLQEVILKCLEINPEKRYSTAKEIGYALAHPHMVKLSEKAKLKRKPGLLTIYKNWLTNRDFMFQNTEARLQPYQRLTTAPHILVAVKLEHSSEELRQSLRSTMQKLSRTEQGSYFTCLSILLKNSANTSESDVQDFIEHSQPRHIQAQAELRHWLQPVGLPESRLNVQVFYGDPAEEIVNYAWRYSVDHILMCAHRSEGPTRVIGNVPGKVIAEAPCSVTVIRTRLDRSES